jgi:YVTN family beta-propeller protein
MILVTVAQRGAIEDGATLAASPKIQPASTRAIALGILHYSKHVRRVRVPGRGLGGRMRRYILGVAAAFLATGCLHRAQVAMLPPLGDEAEVDVYLDALPQEAERLTVSLASLSAASSGGSDAPLELRLTRLVRSEVSSQRMLASGRIPAGSYEGFHVAVKKAQLSIDGKPADLLVPKEPTLISAPFTASRGKATVISLAFRYEASVKGGFEFSPEFLASQPTLPTPQLTGYCSNTASASLTVIDTSRRLVSGVEATGARPGGLAIDPPPGQSRAYVTLAATSEVQVVDVISGDRVGSIRLTFGDDPVELALVPSGRLLLSVNSGSNTLSFLDPASFTELARVPTGLEPASVVLDRTSSRAYVFNRRSNSITVVDVANHAVVTTIPTDPEPFFGAVSRDGTRLYVVCAGSAYLNVYSLPGLGILQRAFTGLGQSAILVDSRSDYVYVGMAGEKRIYVYNPFSFIPIDYVEVPGPVSYMVVDDLTNALFALMPDSRSVAVVDLTSRRVLAVLDVGEAPYALRLAGQRP